MHRNLEKIAGFIKEHHLLTLATSFENNPQCSNLFYASLEDENSFIVASDEKTEHIQNVLRNPQVAASIALETTVIGKIQGFQIKGLISSVEDERAKKIYFKAFPYARVMKPTLWRITVQTMKLTDNRLGFGKKLIWDADKARLE